MFYTYIIENEKQQFYIGYTRDLKRRLIEHNQGLNKSTKKHKWSVVYYEACKEHEDARRRELYFKTSSGRRAVNTRLKVYLSERRKPKLH